MSLPVPLNVTLTTPNGTYRVTRQCRDLSFRSVSPGGFASCQIDLDRPLSLPPSDVDYFANLVVTDGRSGAVVWEGRVEDLGRTAGIQGQVWRIAAIGPSSHASDRTIPYVMVESNISRFTRALTDISPGAHADIREDPGGSGEQGIFEQLPTGLAVSNGSRVVMRYDDIWQAGQKLARVDYSWDAGLTNADYSVRLVARTGGTANFDVARTQTTSTGGSGLDDKVVVTDWNNGRDQVDLELTYTGAPATVGSDIAWCIFMNITIHAMRFNADATEKTTGYTGTVNADDIVGDLLGRLLPLFDGANAVVSTSPSYNIDQLSHPDGATAFEVLGDLLELEPAFTWHAWERNPANGLYRFEFVAWPTTVRYEADVTDGYDGPASGADMYNEVRVRYRTPTGGIRTALRTQTVAALDNAGFDRGGFIDLGDETGTLAGAERAGDQFLAEHATPPNAGRLVVARPIFDRDTGRLVSPWEIRPGHLIRVRGVLPRVDALNATVRDGTTVFKIASVDYRTSAAAAVLELDSYSPSTARALAEIAKTRPRKRRR